MPLRQPSPEIPVITFLSPNKADQGLVEIWNTENADYVPLDLGASHPNSRQYPNFRLGKQAPVQGDERWYIRTWITDETSPEWFNWAQKYSGEDNAFPIFIRTYREPKATYQPRAKQSSLGAFYKLVLDNPGSGFTNGTLPEVTFDSESPTPALAHGVVSPDGTLAECVLDFCGDGYTGNVAFTVDAPANGNPASGTAIIQPISAILLKEEANLYPEDSEFYAQYLQVVRVYETIPGPTFVETSLDVDGAILTTATTRGLCSEIVTGEAIGDGLWCKTTKKPTDIDIICEQVIVCRAIPGNPMVSTKIDEDGKTITRTQTYTATASCVSSEAIVTGVWTKKYIEDVDGTNLVSWQWVETRDVPGNNITEASVDERDGKIQTVVRVMVDASTITPSESITGGNTYTKIEAKPISDLVAWKVTTTRPVPGNDVVKTVIDADGDEVEETRTLVESSTITTTITTSGGVYTKTFQDPITDIIAWKVVQVKATQNELDSFEVEIPDLIPPIFTGLLPVTTTEQTLIGTASLPTLATGDIMRRSAQIDYNTYRLTIRGRASLSLPQDVIVSRQTTEEYGGEVLKTTGYLNSSEPSVETGLGVVSSQVKNLGNGLFFRQTEKWNTATSWPLLTEYDQDPETQSLITTTYQVIDATTVVAPSVVNGVITRYKRIDQWRSIEIIETYSLPADYEEQRFMAHQFPSLWDYTTYNYSTACGPTGPIREGFSTFVQARLAISFTTTKQTITGLTLIPNTIRLVHDIINQVLNDAGTLTYSGTCSGPITFPASDPTFTDYVSGIPIQGTEQLISGESVLWRAGLYKNSSLYVSML